MKKVNSLHKPSSISNGQSLVEFAFMIVVLTIILLGVLDLGRAYFTYMALLDAAGEGATYGSINPTDWCSGSSDDHFDADDDGVSDGCAGNVSADPDNITYRVLHSAPEGTLVDWDSPDTLVTVVRESGAIKPGKEILVKVTTNYDLLTPFIGTIVGSQTLQLSASASAVVLTP